MTMPLVHAQKFVSQIMHTSCWITKLLRMVVGDEMLYFQITLKTVLLPWAQWGKNALSNMQAKMLDISHLLKSNSFFQNFCQHF